MKRILMVGYTLAVLAVGIIVGALCSGSNQAAAESAKLWNGCIYAEEGGPNAINVFLLGACVQQGKKLVITDLPPYGYKIVAK